MQDRANARELSYGPQPFPLTSAPPPALLLLNEGMSSRHGIWRMFLIKESVLSNAVDSGMGDQGHQGVPKQ